MPTATTSAPIVSIDGTEVADQAARDLVELRISRTTGAAAHCELRYDRSVTLTPQVGATLKIEAVEDDADNAVVFEGVIMTVGIEHSARQSQLVIGAYDASFKLGNQIDSTSHLNKTFKQLIEAVAGKAGLQVDVESTLQSEMFEHIQQSGTPHQFLTDLSRAFGCEWYVSDSKLVVKRRTAEGAVATISGEDDLRRFSARFTGSEQATGVEVRGWDPATQAAVSSTATSDGRKTGHVVGIADEGVKGEFPGKQAVAAPISLSAATVATKVAEGIAGRLEAAKISGRGEIDVDGKLAPGKTLAIEDFDPNWNGTYYLTGVEHVFGRSQPFVTRFSFGSLDPTTLVDLLGTAPRTTRDRMTSGISVGEVTDNQDPDGLLRVKVTLPALSDDNESFWARIVAPGAGKERGAMSIPEIGDEVAVAFENGDLQRPYVLGGLWNGKSTAPPYPDLITNGKVMSRSITSRNGHQFDMSDGDDDESQFVQVSLADSKTFLYVGHTMIEITNQNKPIKISNQKATVELAENGDISISGEKITIDAKKDLELSGQNVKVTAKQKLTAEGKSGAELKGGGPVKVESSAVTEVKGSLVKLN